MTTDKSIKLDMHCLLLILVFFFISHKVREIYINDFHPIPSETHPDPDARKRKNNDTAGGKPDSKKKKDETKKDSNLNRSQSQRLPSSSGSDKETTALTGNHSGLFAVMPKTTRILATTMTIFLSHKVFHWF